MSKDFRLIRFNHFFLRLLKWSFSILTSNLLSTVLTTISSGVYWLTSKRSLRDLPSPSSWMSGEFKLSQWLGSANCLLSLCWDVVDELQIYKTYRICFMVPKYFKTKKQMTQLNFFSIQMIQKLDVNDKHAQERTW